jgi:hypothetical protein
LVAFRKATRELGCDESEVNFEAALNKIARHKSKPIENALADHAKDMAERIGQNDPQEHLGKRRPRR